eukprot:6178583-Prymnesium_polylepis.1
MNQARRGSVGTKGSKDNAKKVPELAGEPAAPPAACYHSPLRTCRLLAQTPTPRAPALPVSSAARCARLHGSHHAARVRAQDVHGQEARVGLARQRGGRV